MDSTIPSADTFGRTFSHLDTAGLRKLLKHLYTRLKRNKALGKLCGLDVAVIDGHETSSSFKFRCDGCLKRRVEKKKGTVEQYYHRNTTLMLATPKLKIMLDADEQRPGEDAMCDEAAHKDNEDDAPGIRRRVVRCPVRPGAIHHHAARP